MKILKHGIGYTLTVAVLVTICWGFYVMHQDGYSVAMVLLVSIYTFNVFFTVVVFLQMRHSGAKLSWLMFAAIFPVFGHILFVLFGQRYGKRQSIFKYHKRYTFGFEEKTNKAIERLSDEDKVLYRQSKASNRGIYKADYLLYRSGDKAYKAMFDEMEKAEKFMHIHYYIVKPGEIYEEFKSILIKKAKEGVKIRFIIDDFGRWALPWYEIKFLRQNGIRVEIFARVQFPFLGSENGFRTHRKMVIIDGKTVFTGGINIGDEYSNLSKHYGLWVDYQARITGKAVRSYSLLFLEDWKQITSYQLNPSKYLNETNTGASKSLLVEDSPEIIEPVMQDSLVYMILNAKKSISLTTPYLIPTVEILSAIRSACIAGVEVNLYIPGRADKKTVLLSTRYYADLFQAYGANIYELKDMLIHSKLGVFDSKYAYLGTENLDMRSLHSQFELMSIVTGQAVGQVDKLFDYYKKLSRVVPKGEFETKFIKKRLIRFYVNLLSPIM